MTSLQPVLNSSPSQSIILCPNFAWRDVDSFKLSRKTGKRFECSSHVGDDEKLSGPTFPLEARDLKDTLLFKRQVYQNDAGETKVVFERVKCENLQILEANKFLDFKYSGKTNSSNLVDFFESTLDFTIGLVLGKTPELDLSSIAFEQELYPKILSREYVHASQPIE